MPVSIFSSPARRSPGRVVALVAAALAGLGAGAAAPALAAPAPVPCTSVDGGHYNCTFYVEGDGISGGAPVLGPSGNRVGYLRRGVNFVICQRPGREEHSGAYFNNWWAWTQADDNAYGWVSAVWASGGDNDGKFGGVPDCGNAHGQPPGGVPDPITPPPPGTVPPPSPCSDCDGDKYPVEVDCNDHNAAIHPNAGDRPGDGVDSDCSGGDSTYPRLDSQLPYAFTYAGRSTVVRQLSVQPARAGTTVRLRCTGRGCRFKVKTRAVRTDVRKLNLSALVRGSKLRPGAQLEIRVTRADTIGLVRRLRMRSRKPPASSDRCLMPGAARPIACPL
jgi:hypothetical protein